MPILIHRAYAETTPESAEDGDFSDRGTLAVNEPCTFRELVRYLKEHPECSCSPAVGAEYEWYSSGFTPAYDADGTEREETIHYSRDNPPRMLKYWRKAAIAAGVAK
jgi:hypothetical protein